MSRIKEASQALNNFIDVTVAQSPPVSWLRWLAHGGDPVRANELFVREGIATPRTLNAYVDGFIGNARRAAEAEYRRQEQIVKLQGGGELPPKDQVIGQAVSQAAKQLHQVAMQYANQNPGRSAAYAEIADRCYQLIRRG